MTVVNDNACQMNLGRKEKKEIIGIGPPVAALYTIRPELRHTSSVHMSQRRVSELGIASSL